MKKTLPNILMLTLALAGAATGCKKYTGEEAAVQRQQWIASLNDSLKNISSQRNADSIRLEGLHHRLSAEIRNFTEIANEREVEPYYILRRYRKRYPLVDTGVAARMTKSEQAELIAALAGARFDAIRVSSGDESALSATVPADQALNYTAAGLTTVCFSGPAADSICMLVSRHMADPVSLEYLQGGRQAGKITLTPIQKDWIGATWSVVGTHKEARQLEHAMLIDSRKIEILKITIAQEASKAATERPAPKAK